MVRNRPHLRPSRARLSTTGVLTACLLVAAVASPAPSGASDDHTDLHQRKHELSRSIDAQKTDVDQVSRQLLRTQARLVAARGSLQDARVELSAVRGEVRAAADIDSQMQAELDLAIDRLRDARADLAQGRSDVSSNREALAGYAVSNYQAGGFSLGTAFESGSAQEALNDLQAADTVLNKQASALQKLRATRVLLRLTTKRVHDSKVAVARQRVLAATHLATKRELEAQARVAKRAVVDRVEALRGVRSDMAAAKHTEIRRLHVLQSERDRVTSRLKAIAERRARRHARQLRRERALARQRAAEAAQARQRLIEAARASQHLTEPTPAPPPLPDTGFLDYPVHDTYVTSTYGMRLHPVLRIYELHDGTDLHAPCGSPVYAAADGRVMEEYYNAGYGNRLLLDHGYVEGVSLATSYNHLTSFVAGVGERVQRGQLIAYAGDTGWSTACHVHFMVYVDGSAVDPVTWL